MADDARARAGSTRLADRAWPGIRQQSMLIVPLGSTEQHGPHLPLDTDTRIATAVADAVAQRLHATGVDVLVAPAIAYGSSGEHQAFPGTVSIGTSVLTSLLVEYGRSACTWAERLLIVNGHGGNVDALAGAVPMLRSEGRDVAWAPCAAPAAGGAGASGAVRPADAHAGRAETSLLLHLARASVALDRLEAGNEGPLTELLPELRAGGVHAVSINGILGDPHGASAEEGKGVLGAIVDEVVACIAVDTVDERGRLMAAAT